MELQSGSAQFGSKSAIFSTPCDLEIWQMTLINNRAPLLCYFKLCASFHNYLCIQPELHSGNANLGQNWRCFVRVILKFDGYLEKKHFGTSPKPHQALCIISSPSVHSTWGYSPETTKLVFDICGVRPLTPDLDILHGYRFCHHSWKLKIMMIHWWRHSEKGVTGGQTDGQSERRVLRAAWSQLKRQKTNKHSKSEGFDNCDRPSNLTLTMD